MRYGDRISETTVDTKNLFADYFESIYVPDEETWDFDEIYVESRDSVEINIPLFDIESVISSLKWKSGAGPDELSPYVVKKCETSTVWPIFLLYHKTSDEGKIPEAMKISLTVLVYKRKGDKSEVKNYRVVENSRNGR